MMFSKTTTKNVSSLLILLSLIHSGESFVARPFFAQTKRSYHALYDAKDDVLDEVKKQIGSAFNFASKEASKKINELTGKDDYEFGDLAKLLDAKARAAVSDLTDKEEAGFGDLLKLAESKANAMAAELETKEEWAKLKDMSGAAGTELQGRLADFMGKENAPDLNEVQETATKEIVEILKSREYGIADLFFLLRLCTSFGLGMNPAVMAIFPLNVLVQLYNLSLIQEAGRGVTTAVALEMDRRARKAMALEMDKQAKVALFGDADIEVGEAFKQAVLKNTNKSEYSFGDITSTLLSALDDEDKDIAVAVEPIGVVDEAGNVEELDAELVKDLEALDKALEEEVDEAPEEAVVE